LVPKKLENSFVAFPKTGKKNCVHHLGNGKSNFIFSCRLMRGWTQNIIILMIMKWMDGVSEWSSLHCFSVSLLHLTRSHRTRTQLSRYRYLIHSFNTENMVYERKQETEYFTYLENRWDETKTTTTTTYKQWSCRENRERNAYQSVLCIALLALHPCLR
jgi:hypothetical protein